MATAGDIVNRALRLLGVVGIGYAAAAEEMQEGLAAFTAMMAAWENEGVYLGPIAGDPLAVATDIPLPPSHEEALQYNLAKRLAGEYGRALKPEQLEIAENGFRALQAAYAEVPEMCPDAGLRSTYHPWGLFRNV